MLLLIASLVHMRVGVDLLTVVVAVIVVDVRVLVARVGVFVDFVTVLVLVIMGRVMRVLSHWVLSLSMDLTSASLLETSIMRNYRPTGPDRWRKVYRPRGRIDDRDGGGIRSGVGGTGRGS